MKKRFTRNLALLTFAVLMFNSNIKAQYSCTDISPDSVVAIAPGATAQHTFDLDINNDAIMDFRISMVQNGSFGFVNVQAGQIATSNSVLANGSNTALALSAGAPITPTSLTWVQLNGSNQNMSSFALSPPAGSFPGMGDRYLGLQFVVGPNTYFGWARFNFSNVVNSFTVMDYGYNTVPNGSITAGQACAVVFTPSFSISSPKCAGTTSTLTANTGTAVVSGYTWSALPAGPTFGTPNASVTTVTFPTSGTFTISLAATSGTTATTSNTVLVNPAPSLSFATTNTMLCAGQPATITASGATTYSWSTGSSTNVTVVNPSVTSTYTLTGTNSFSCSTTAMFTQSVNVCAGISQFGSNNESFSVYPNPANDKLFIKINTSEALVVSVEVTDIVGKTIIKQNQNYGVNENTHSINISDVSKGVFFVKIISGTGSSQVMKVIKE